MISARAMRQFREGWAYAEDVMLKRRSQRAKRDIDMMPRAWRGGWHRRHNRAPFRSWR